MTPIDNDLVVGTLLFVLGAIGFLTRRNLILMMLSAELMLHGVGLTLVAFSAAHGHLQGQAFAILVLTVAACEAGVSLALILTVYRRTKSLNVDLWRSLGETPPEPSAPPTEPAPTSEPAATPAPRLTPAGRRPTLGDLPAYPASPTAPHHVESEMSPRA